MSLLQTFWAARTRQQYDAKILAQFDLNSSNLACLSNIGLPIIHLGNLYFNPIQDLSSSLMEDEEQLILGNTNSHPFFNDQKISIALSSQHLLFWWGKVFSKGVVPTPFQYVNQSLEQFIYFSMKMVIFIEQTLGSPTLVDSETALELLFELVNDLIQADATAIFRNKAVRYNFFWMDKISLLSFRLQQSLQPTLDSWRFDVFWD